MSQLAAVDISDSDRFELAEVLKEESESSSVPRPLEDILEETCDDDFDSMSQRSCYEIEHSDIERAVAAKCPIEMGGYDTLEQLQRAWDTRRPDSAAGDSSGDATDVEA